MANTRVGLFVTNRYAHVGLRIEQMKTIFKSIDTNGDGVISPREFREAWSRMEVRAARLSLTSLKNLQCDLFDSQRNKRRSLPVSR